MKSRSSELRRARPLLGTLVEIRIEGADAENAIAAAFLEVEAVHQLMSFHDPFSDISRINRAAPDRVLTIDARTWAVLDFAKRLHQQSAGAFDVAIGAALVAAGFLPPPSDVPPAPEACSDDLLLLPNQQVMVRKRLWIDLGGIAKGYAVDRAVAVLRERGVVSGCVNAGGDLRVFGRPQVVHIRHPMQPQLAFSLGEVHDLAVASSSGCYSAVEREGGVIDPLVGADQRCQSWQGGITVLAPTCMAADALTKVVRLMPCDPSALLEEIDARAIVVDRDGHARALPSVH